MEYKNLATNRWDCYKLLRLITKGFNIKLLNEQELENLGDDLDYPPQELTYNPFGHPAYWIFVGVESLDVEIPKVRFGETPQTIYYKKLMTCSDLKALSPFVSYQEFLDYFFEEDIFVSKPYHHFGSQTIKMSPNFSTNKIWKVETMKSYYERCMKKYKTKFIYKITLLITCTQEIEFEYKLSPPNWKLENDPNLPPERIWKEKKIVQDPQNIAPLLNLAIELSSCFEANNILNYIIMPETGIFDYGLIKEELERETDESWGDFNPYG